MSQEKYLDLLHRLEYAYTVNVVLSSHLHGTGSIYIDTIISCKAIKSAHDTLRAGYMEAYPNGLYVAPL